jgi:hypothetical protein
MLFIEKNAWKLVAIKIINRKIEMILNLCVNETIKELSALNKNQNDDINNAIKIRKIIPYI